MPNPNDGIRICQIQMMALERTTSESWLNTCGNPDVDYRHPEVGLKTCEIRMLADTFVYLGSSMKALKFCCCRILGKYFDVVYCWLVIWTELGENKIIIVNCFPFLPLPPALSGLFFNQHANT